MIRSIPIVTILSLSLLGSTNLNAQERKQRSDDAGRPATVEVESRVLFAASQFDIISVLLDEGSFSAVPEEFSRILELGLTGPNERMVTQAAWKIVEHLRNEQQFGVAHQIVDSTLDSTEQSQNRFSLLMMRAKVFQEQKLYKQAITALREAQQLQPPQ